MKVRLRLKLRNKRRWNNSATYLVRLSSKDTTLIPAGHYCYDSIEHATPAESPILYRFTPCPYWKRLLGKYDARCTYLEVTDDSILWDRVKICGEKRHED